jgi:hypothetical protein
MTHFATPDDESSPAAVELSAGLGRITEAPTHYGLLFLVVNRTVIARVVSITEHYDADGWWTR